MGAIIHLERGPDGNGVVYKVESGDRTPPSPSARPPSMWARRSARRKSSSCLRRT